MGHRANYAIKENGSVKLYYSHWGAISVAQDMFWGPEIAKESITQLQQVPADHWLDDLWGEGGVALDIDSKRMTLFGGDTLSSGPILPVYLRLIQALWAEFGWTVEWAYAGMPAIAAAVGMDPSLATAGPLPPIAIGLGVIGKKLRAGQLALSTLITVVENDGIVHRVSDVHASGMLANGPQLLDVLTGLPTLESIEEVWEMPEFMDDFAWSLGDEFTCSIIVWRSEKRLGFREFNSDISTVGYLASVWNGWDISRFSGGMDEHFAQINQEAPESLKEAAAFATEEISIAEDRCIDEIAAILLAPNQPRPEDMVPVMFEDDPNDEEISEPLEAPVQPALDIRVSTFSRALAAMYTAALR